MGRMGLEQNRRFGSGMPKRQGPDGDNSPVLYELSGYKVHEYSLNMALHLKDPESACSSGLGRDAALSNWEGQAGRVSGTEERQHQREGVALGQLGTRQRDARGVRTRVCVRSTF